MPQAKTMKLTNGWVPQDANSVPTRALARLIRVR
jgi:hypothetical protein